MNLGQNVCLDHLWVRFSKCYDTQVSVTGRHSPLVIFVFKLKVNVRSKTFKDLTAKIVHKFHCVSNED